MLNKPLVWYVDLNATILMTDPTGGKKLEDVINDSLCRISWGRLSGRDRKQWVQEPSIPLSQWKPKDLDVISYETVVDEILIPTPSDFDTRCPEERAALWRQLRNQRKQLKKEFTAPGHPGSDLCDPYVSKMKQSLMRSDGTEVNLTPVFFHTVRELLRMTQAAGVPLYIIFRTFGGDGARVCEEWNQFVQRSHKYEAFQSGVDGAPFVISASHTGTYHRSEQGVALTWVHTSDTNAEPLTWTGSIPEIQRMWTRKLIHENPKGAAFSIRDDYPFWAAGREQPQCGKPVAVHDSLPYYSVFTDDNISTQIGSTRGIVDCRDAVTGDSMNNDAKLSNYLVPVDTYHACVDKDYFLDAISSCITKQSQT